jgi:hypothetical protein
MARFVIREDEHADRFAVGLERKERPRAARPSAGIQRDGGIPFASLGGRGDPHRHRGRQSVPLRRGAREGRYGAARRDPLAPRAVRNESELPTVDELTHDRPQGACDPWRLRGGDAGEVVMLDGHREGSRQHQQLDRVLAIEKLIALGHHGPRSGRRRASENVGGGRCHEMHNARGRGPLAGGQGVTGTMLRSRSVRRSTPRSRARVARRGSQPRTRRTGLTVQTPTRSSGAATRTRRTDPGVSLRRRA